MNNVEPPTMPQGPTEWLVYLNLDKPWKRALVVATAAGLVYLAVQPRCFFDEQGKMRKQHIPYVHSPRLPDDPEDKSTNVHFLTVPVGCGLLAGVFT